jgi:hypothetical protein
MNTQSHSPLRSFRAALNDHGIHTYEDYDELVHQSPDGDLRIFLKQKNHDQLLRCFISVSEERLLTSGLELFNDVALEGHPVVAYGAGRGQACFEFAWVHPDEADWRISAERVEVLLQRVHGALCPRLARRRFAREILEGVLAHPATAA